MGRNPVRLAAEAVSAILSMTVLVVAFAQGESTEPQHRTGSSAIVGGYSPASVDSPIEQQHARENCLHEPQSAGCSTNTDIPTPVATLPDWSKYSPRNCRRSDVDRTWLPCRAVMRQVN